MVSGRIAGFHAIKCIENKDFSASAMQGYDLAIEEKYGKLMRSRKRIEHFYATNHWSLNWFTSVLNHSKIISKYSQKIVHKLLA